MSRESRTSTSLTYAESMASDDEYVDEDELEKGERAGRRGRGERRRSMASMPGSLDGIRFEVDAGVDGGDEAGYEGGEDEGGEEVDDGEEATEEAFDEDFDATTQMKNVPFL
jgi:phosphatidate phosphatase LPIN